MTGEEAIMHDRDFRVGIFTTFWSSSFNTHLIAEMSKVDAKQLGSDLKLSNTDLKSDSEGPYDTAASSVQDEVVIHINEDQKLGVTGAVFLILNKMIGTGSTLFYRHNFLRVQLNVSIQSSQHPLVSSPPPVRLVSHCSSGSSVRFNYDTVFPYSNSTQVVSLRSPVLVYSSNSVSLFPALVVKRTTSNAYTVILSCSQLPFFSRR